MLFSHLLSRADDETLQLLLGGRVLRLLRLLDPGMVTPSRLQQLLIDLHSSAGLLLDAQSRKLLLELLKPAEAEMLVQVLGLPNRSDAYQALSQFRPPRGSERERALFDFFELVPPAQSDEEPSPASENINPALPLFSHQRQAASRVRAALETAPRRVLLHMPTGAGKTRTAMQIIADHLRAHEPTLVIWMAYSEELCEQAAADFSTAWSNLGDRELGLYRFWGERNLDFSAVADGLVVASLGKLYNAAMDRLEVLSKLSARCSLVIIDEAHQAIAPTYRLVLDTLVTQGRSAALLGLSATPGRTWNDPAIDAELATFFGRRKVTLQIEGYANPVDYLVDQGYLARASFSPLFHHGGLQLSENDLRRIESELDLSPELLRQLAADEQRNLAIVIKVEELVRHHKRMMLFAASVEHSSLLAAVLRARGIDANSISGNTPSAERTRLITHYKDNSDEPKVLCNYGVLTTGFDAPRTSAAIIARPTRSLVLYSQMVGRAIRGSRVGGNRTAEIVTVIDRELSGFSNIAQAFSNWEDVWSEQ